MARQRKCGILLALVICMVVPLVSEAGIIDTASLRVTDVTPVQFKVVWATAEPAVSSSRVFLDENGTLPCAEAEVISESAQHPPAEDIGVMKVRVTGLKPDTSYFFQMESKSKITDTVSLYPQSPPFLEVRTEKSSTVVRNDVLAQKIDAADSQPSKGMLVIASVAKASYPVSGWVGDGVPEQWAAIDMNNFYDRDSHSNLQLSGGEVIDLTLFGGSLGSFDTQDAVPSATGNIQPLSNAIQLPVSGPTPSPSPTPAPEGGGSGGGGGGGGCFIATAAFGSPVESHVNTLREFRDEYLMPHPLGRKVVEYYYRHSPPVANFISNHENIKTIVRWSLLPIASSVYLFMYERTVLFISLLLVMFVTICLKISLTSTFGRG